MISVDDYCCDNEWDTICQATYDYCDNNWTGPIVKRTKNKKELIISEYLEIANKYSDIQIEKPIKINNDKINIRKIYIKTKYIFNSESSEDLDYY